MKNSHSIFLLSLIFAIIFAMIYFKEELNLKFHEGISGKDTNYEKNSYVKAHNSILFMNDTNMIKISTKIGE
ncbi:MAG: hypothetical protein H0X62_11645 [Bacteroidetes bacterium]|nr:hypothetical protein [Bacteroidota bacterium]